MLTRKMKDSGVEWIGEIPESWEMKKVKSFLKERSEKNHPNEEVLSLYREYGVIPKNSRNDNHNVTSLDTSTYKFVEENNVVINKMKAWQGSLAVSKYRGIVSPAYYIYEIKKATEIVPEFLHYALRNPLYTQEYKRLSAGLRVGQWDLNKSEFNSLLYPIPPVDEQLKIVEFINNKNQSVAQIIQDTQQSIEELKKYKQSLITEVVTKGLDKNVEMKDSGVEWIGEVPRHWRVSRPNRVSSIIRGNTSFQKIDMKNNGDFVAVQYGQIYKFNELDDKYQFYIDKSFYKKDQVVQKEDTIFVSTSETMEDLGHSCFYKREDLGLLGGEQLCLRPNNENIFGKFFYYATTYFKYELNQYATGLKVYRFKLDDLKKINIVVPPIKEQYKIVSFLDEQTSRIDKLIADKIKVIKELEGYKKSLIYEYVTGKKQV